MTPEIRRAYLELREHIDTVPSGERLSWLIDRGYDPVTAFHAVITLALTEQDHRKILYG